jgi:integrase
VGGGRVLRGGWRRRVYGVSNSEIVEFLKFDSVRSFLGRHEFEGSSWKRDAHGLCSFFKWLRLNRGLKLSPDQFLREHRRRRRSDEPEDLRWALQLALDFSRDNPDLAGRNGRYKWSSFFLPVKLFCDLNETPLTSARGVYKRKGGRTYREPECTSERIRRALAVVNQRDRAVLMTQLQSGQSVTQVLVDISMQADYLFREIDAGKPRVRIDFDERKGNESPYFTFIGADAIQEIQKWRPLRAARLEELGVKSAHLFINREGQPLKINSFLVNLREKLERRGLWTGPYSFRTHMLRQFFKSAASPPDIGVSRAYVEFMMGHQKRAESNENDLDAVGGVYDKAPYINPRVVEKEYIKLEPYLNILSCQRPEELPITETEWQELKELLALMKQGKIRVS